MQRNSLLVFGVVLGLALVVMMVATPAPVPMPSGAGGSPSAASSAPDRSPGWTTYRSTQAGFQVELPDGWRIRAEEPEPPWSVVFSDGLEALEVLVGEVGATVRTCVEPRDWEICHTLAPESLDEMARATHAGWSARHSSRFPFVVSPSVVTSPISMGGEPARHVAVAYQDPPQVAEYVDYFLVLHGGRLYVMRFYSPSHPADGVGHTWFGELLSGFSFIN